MVKNWLRNKIVFYFMIWAQRKGMAIVVFTPEEIQTADPHYMEECMIEEGWSVICCEHNYDQKNLPHIKGARKWPKQSTRK